MQPSRIKKDKRAGDKEEITSADVQKKEIRYDNAGVSKSV